MKKKIGSRGSKLALWQANYVKDRLHEIFPDLEIEIIIIKTEGDKRLDAPLSEIGGKGLFIKEIEDSLIKKEIDIAVHSLKDMTTQIPDGLTLAAVTKREDPRDCLITANGCKLEELPHKSCIGTSSLRRRAQILNLRPDLVIKPLRGNLDTRLKKLFSGEYDGIITAFAGLKRLEKEDQISQRLPLDHFIPAVGQGALGIETRADDAETLNLVEKLNDEKTSYCASAERSFLKKMEGSCKAPIAANAVIEKPTLQIRGMVASLDGKNIISHSLSGKIENAEEIGYKLGEELLNKGADRILAQILGG